MPEPRMMGQTAPYPVILQRLVDDCKLGLDQSWSVDLWDNHQRDKDFGRGESRGLTLVITTNGFDTYHPERGPHYRVHHYFIVPAATYDERSWRRWLFERYVDVWRHEAMESFVVGDERPYAPSHGPGNDPYLVRELGSIEDQTTRFTGEQNPGRFMTAQEAADILGVSVSTIKRMCAKGKLRAQRVGSRWLVDRIAVMSASGSVAT